MHVCEVSGNTMLTVSQGPIQQRRRLFTPISSDEEEGDGLEVRHALDHSNRYSSPDE
jgi:hypothetical protein